MEIVLAKSAGFCFGVSNAVEKAYDLSKEYKNIYTLGPIIHNDQVIEKLANLGVKTLDRFDDIPKGSLVIIRAHGVAPQIYEQLTQANMIIKDATCPNVTKIHNLVREKSEAGYQIVIVGDKNHPEVIGISGWAFDSAFVAYSKEDVDKLVMTEKCICVVAQTTITQDKWEQINIYLKDKFHCVEKFDTICSATNKRQKEAMDIARNVDLMLVIGGINSSNTQKLYDVCVLFCNNSYKIETALDLPQIDINKIKKIGITAGASTPDWVIREVINKMGELNKQLEEEEEMSFKEIFEGSLVSIQSGQIMKGKIIGFNSSEVFVNLGYKSDGVIPIEQFTEDSDYNPDIGIVIGEQIEVYVVRVNDKEGTVVLSKKIVDAHKTWDVLEKALADKTPVKVKVIDVVSAGVIANASGVRVFIPASHLGERYVKDLQEFNKQTFDVRIIEMDKFKKKVVGSRKILVQEARSGLESAFWTSIEPGKTYEGTVKSLTSFGAFVDIGAVDGLVHISEISWAKIKHPSEVFTVGDKITVYILEFDKDKRKISLGFKRKEDNPWMKINETYKIGDLVTGKVARLVPFGAFIELADGIDGLVHISQISTKRLSKPEEVLTIGQVIEAKVMDVNVEQKKISLSIKEANPIITPEPNSEIVEDLESSLPKTPKNSHVEELTNTIGDSLKSADESSAIDNSPVVNASPVKDK